MENYLLRFLCLCGSILHGVESAGVQARQNSCSAATTTIQNAEDATSLASACSTFTGSIALATSLVGDIAFDGLQEIQGSLIATNVTELITLRSDSLHTITESLSIESTTILSTVNFTQLQSVREIDLTAIPALQELSILQTVENVSTISIQNTQIDALEGFSIQTIEQFYIANNNYLNTINLQPYNITGILAIEANGRDLSVSMPNIQFAQNMTFRNVSSISIPSITQINGSLGVYDNLITSFNGAPLLQSVGGLNFASNSLMANISLPELTNVFGPFQVVNNSALSTLDELYSLTTIDGAVDLEGNFTDIQFPNIQNVRGGFHIRSSEDMSCNSFDDLDENFIIKGVYSCVTASDQANATRGSSSFNSESSASTTSTTSTASSAPSMNNQSTGISDSAQIGVGVGVGVGGTALLVAIAFLLFRWRRKRRAAQRRDGERLPEADGTEVDGAAMLGNENEKHELEQPVEELPSGKTALAQELPAGHGETELGRNTSTKAPGVESRHEMPANETPEPMTRASEDETNDRS